MENEQAITWSSLLTRIKTIFGSPELETITGALDKIGKCTIVFTACVWLYECSDRRQLKHDAAWGLINSAHGKSGDAGRSVALRTLLKDDVALSGIDLTNALLSGYDFRHAQLSMAIFTSADLRLTRFDCQWLTFLKGWCTNLYGATFKNAAFVNTKFYKARLTDATFEGGSNPSANIDFERALLIGTTFRNMRLSVPDFKNAILMNTKFIDVEFTWPGFAGAQLKNVDLTQTNADLRMLAKAHLCNVTLRDRGAVNKNCSDSPDTPDKKPEGERAGPEILPP